MAISEIEQGVVRNLRQIYGQDIQTWSDEVISKAWKEFSLSDEYPDKNNEFFPLWCEAVAHDKIS